MAEAGVTIGIIAADLGDGFERALASARAQSHADCALVVVTPENPGIADAEWIEARPGEPIGPRYDRFRAHATSDYLLLLDEYASISPDTVEKSVAFLEAHLDHVAVYGPTHYETPAGSETCLPVAVQASEPEKRVEALFRHLTHTGPWYGLRRRQAADFPLQTSLGAELYYLAYLAWSGAIGAIGDIQCRVETAPGFHVSRADVTWLGCPAYQAEDPALSAIALLFCGLGIVDERYSALSMLERLRLATLATDALRARTEILDEILLIPYCSRLFNNFNITKAFRDIRCNISRMILSKEVTFHNNYIMDIVNCLCRYRVGNLPPDQGDAGIIERMDRMLSDQPTEEERNRVTLVSAMYY